MALRWGGGGGGGGEMGGKKNSSTKNTKSIVLVPSLYISGTAAAREDRLDLGKQPEF